MQSTIPKRLRALLDAYEHAGPALQFVESCDRILADNQMPFFPAYTNHGTPHISSVLDAAERRLVPEAVWEEELLTPEDGVVLVAAGFLHDLALHLREAGFLALVAEDSKFKPLPWFSAQQRDRSADAPWPELWLAFRKEARRFSQSQLERILGPAYRDPPQIAFGDFDREPGNWTSNDRLLIGEFLRRHHARLAHEIAIYGFPGGNEKEFPVLADSLPSLAEAVGAVARSHNEDLRVMVDYLDDRSKGNLRPGGVVQLYLMGLLRVADYFQLEPQRATPLLMHLREPQSPFSVEEWEKHQAISAISWDHKDPHAVTIQISPSHNLRTHLQLGELIAELQSELDVTAAVLSETYGSTTLDDLQLKLQRVRTNLDEPVLHGELGFVPIKGRLRSAEDLFRLVVGDLYGNEPSVAGRELLQNAIDAVRELRGWLERRDETIAEKEFHDIPADVLVEVRAIDDDSGLLRIVDRGIGMTPATVVSSFLTAGSTYREPFDDEEMDRAAALKWMKTGRFGVGVLASFLLGDEVQVSTRHIAADRGLRFIATMDDDLVQIDWVDDAPFGTEIVVPFSFDQLPMPFEWEGDAARRYRHLIEQIAGYYQLTSPSVAYRIRDKDGEIDPGDFLQEIPDPEQDLPDSWRSLEILDFDAVLWSLPAKEFRLDGFLPAGFLGNRVAHNGMVIRRPEEDGPDDAYDWSTTNMERLLRGPSIAVFDYRQRLGIALNRYELADRTLGFEPELLDSVGRDLVAHGLVSGAQQHPLGREWGLSPIVTETHSLPLIPALADRYLEGDLVVLWFEDRWASASGAKLLGPRFEEQEWPESSSRVALGLGELFVDDDFENEERGDPTLSGRARRATISLGLLLNLDPVACISMPTRETPETLSLHRGGRGMEEALLAIAENLSEVDDGLTVALAALRRPDESPEPRDEILARPWIEIVGGMLERDPDDREKRKGEVVEKADGLRNLVETWERHSQVPDWSD